MRIIRIEAVAAQMKFDVARFTVTAGEEVVIELVNKDEMPHNLLVTKEGALETVGLAAEAMVALPDAFAKNFIPKTPEVLFAIRLLNPGETVQARFTAPTQPGNYPFVCTFPGHWRTMNGIVEVAAARARAQVTPSHDASPSRCCSLAVRSALSPRAAPGARRRQPPCPRTRRRTSCSSPATTSTAPRSRCR